MGLKISDILTNLQASKNAIVSKLVGLKVPLDNGDEINSSATFAQAAEALKNLNINEGKYSTQLKPSQAEDGKAIFTLPGRTYYVETTEVSVAVDHSVHNGGRRIYASDKAFEVTPTVSDQFLTKVRVEGIPIRNPIDPVEGNNGIGKISASKLISTGANDTIYSVIAPDNYVDPQTNKSTQAYMTQVDIEKVVLGEYTVDKSKVGLSEIKINNSNWGNENWTGLSQVTIPEPDKTTYAKLYNIGDVNSATNIADTLPAGFINASTITVNVAGIYEALAAL